MLSVVLGYYFNNQFVAEYAPPGGLHNFIWGPGSWAEFIALGYDNPAAASASQDYTIMTLLLFPAWLLVDGSRRGGSSTRGCIWGGSSCSPVRRSRGRFYLATIERQHRHQQQAVTAGSAA